MNLIALALAPGFAIMFYIYSKDKYDREPFKNLLIAFILGVLSTVPAIIIQLTLEPQVLGYFQTKSVGYYALFAFVVVGFGEELSKFIMLRFYAFRLKVFNEPFDGIIYSVMVSMGFATLENLNYVWEYGYVTGIVRLFLSVPAHAAFGVIMGYHAGLAKFDPAHSGAHLWKGLLLAAFFHGAYDFFLFLQESKEVTVYVSTGLLFAGALVSYWIAIRMALKSIRLHQELSKQAFHNRNNLV
ncbi:MAG: PrsW family intramembrane metalloprotease [Chitinophagaceae bacterium]|nr:PrsW family intramembrane metalloprotease [Chitinophagaceae bacterium]